MSDKHSDEPSAPSTGEDKRRTKNHARSSPAAAAQAETAPKVAPEELDDVQLSHWEFVNFAIDLSEWQAAVGDSDASQFGRLFTAFADELKAGRRSTHGDRRVMGWVAAQMGLGVREDLAGEPGVVYMALRLGGDGPATSSADCRCMVDERFAALQQRIDAHDWPDEVTTYEVVRLCFLASVVQSGYPHSLLSRISASWFKTAAERVVLANARGDAVQPFGSDAQWDWIVKDAATLTNFLSRIDLSRLRVSADAASLGMDWRPGIFNALGHPISESDYFIYKKSIHEHSYVINKQHMSAREEVLQDIFEKAGHLTDDELHEIQRRVGRMIFMHGREEEEAKILAILAHPEQRPPKFKDRRPGEDVVSFLKSEYGPRGLLNGYLTRKILRDFDATCEGELSRFIRANGEVPELNIPKAINFPDGAKMRSRLRDRTIS